MNRSITTNFISRFFTYSLLVTSACFFSGCDQESENTSTKKEVKETTPPLEAPVEKVKEMTVAELRKELGASSKAQFMKVAGRFDGADLSDSGVTDLSPLKGHPIKRLGLNNLKIDDISAIEGMPLTVLYMMDTNISDISALEGCPLEQLNTMNSPVTSVAALAKAPLNTLWLVNTKVEDLSPLAGNTMISLDVQGSPIKDLSPIAELPNLQRLNIVGTEVTDLSPLKGTKLNRLLFTPEKITKGLDVIRSIPTLQTIGTKSLDDGKPMPAMQFWLMMDAKKAEKKEAEPEEKKTDAKKTDAKKKDAKKKDEK